MALKLDSKLARGLKQRYRLVPHLEKFAEQGDFEWSFDYKPKQGDTAWHPSGDCTPSLEALYLQARGKLETTPISGSLYRTFMVGHFWHQYIQESLLRLGFCDPKNIERRGKRVWKEQNGEPVPFFWATGSGDVAPVTIPNDGDYLLDIKTMNSFDFKGNQAPARYVDKWECQTNIYMDFFDLDKALILGVQKDSPHAYKEFFFARNDDLIEAIYGKWKMVGRCLEEEILPPHEEEWPLPLKGPQ